MPALHVGGLHATDFWRNEKVDGPAVFPPRRRLAPMCDIIGEEPLAKVSDSRIRAPLMSREGRIVASIDCRQKLPSLAAGLVRRQGAVLAEGEASGVTVLSVLDDVGLEAAAHDANAETGHLIVKNQAIGLAGLQSVDCSFGKLRHRAVQQFVEALWKQQAAK